MTILDNQDHIVRFASLSIIETGNGKASAVVTGHPDGNDLEKALTIIAKAIAEENYNFNEKIEKVSK